MSNDGRGLACELDVAFSSPEEFGRLVLEWLTEGVRSLAGDASDEILAGPPLKPYWHEGGGIVDEEDPAFSAHMPPLWGDVSILYPPRNMHYEKPYSRTSLKRLTALAPVLESAWVSLYWESAAGSRQCSLGVSRVGEDSGYAGLLVSPYPGEDGDYPADCPAVAFMRGFAERHAAVFGHVSYEDPDSAFDHAETELEQALRRYPWETLPEWDRYLRGYSWVTVVPAVLAAHVGGAGGLRGSGAFASVDEVAGGSLWLQATSRWSQYSQDQAVVDRVFQVLAPVLPPGRPESYRLVRPGAPGMPEITVPYLLSVRDAADHGAGR